MSKAKPFSISKREVWEAYKRVKANKGGAGVDGVSIEEFEKDLGNNLYKLWNRMSSGSYFPPPVRRVDIPKPDGRKRPLGIPTVADRIAQAVVKARLEPEVEKHFHPDSYGYRVGKSAVEAVGVARKRCWQYDWVLDIDIKGFFDNLDHELLMRAVRKHTDCKWVLLYTERWLKTPVQLPDGFLVKTERGTPQGGVISPLLANLFLHYAFDAWMQRNQPDIPFERYADDVVCHCKSKAQAQRLLGMIRKRLAECKLELNQQKTQIVYCKDDRRKGNYHNTEFDFLGFTFQHRGVRGRSGDIFMGFNPAVSKKAIKVIRSEIRSWRLHLRSDINLLDLSRIVNPILRGWVNYYGHYFRSRLYYALNPFHRILVKWAMRKYKKFKGHQRRASQWILRIRKATPQLFAHWRLARVHVAG
ncbi:group II intron reverse transcriptase/maturase [Thermodesulfobacteriota bacterium]